jgi:hypothetical protein
VSQFQLNLVVLNLPFLSQILSDPLEILPGDWEYVQLTGDLCFIKKCAFLVELWKCNTGWWCNISRWMTVSLKLGKDIIIYHYSWASIYIYIGNSIVLIGNFLYLGMCLPAGGGGPYFK